MRISGKMAVATGVTFIALLLAMRSVVPTDSGVIRAQELPAQELPLSESGTTKPANRYVGTTKCGACHFAQFKDWRSSAHGQSFEILPLKYRNDESCLKCHMDQHSRQMVTSLESPGQSMTGVSCESCHGPGGDHVQYGLSFIGRGRELTEESLTIMRSKIKRMSLERCVTCHTAIAHKPHPEYDREETTETRGSSIKLGPASLMRLHR